MNPSPETPKTDEPAGDARSDSSAAVPIPQSHIDLFDKKTFWHVATIGPDGNVQSTPVWGDLQDGQFVFSLTTSRQKYKNLMANGSIAVSGVDPDNPYRSLELRGSIDGVDSDPARTFIDAMAKKYLDADTYPFHQPGDERVVMRMTPRHTTSRG